MHTVSHSTSYCISSVTEVDNLQGLYPLKEEWIISCSLETRLVDQMKSSTTEVCYNSHRKWLRIDGEMSKLVSDKLWDQTGRGCCLVHTQHSFCTQQLRYVGINIIFILFG